MLQCDSRATRSASCRKPGGIWPVRQYRTSRRTNDAAQRAFLVHTEGERIVTIEDAVELQLQQEHVDRLESRPPNIEGKGAITIRDLVRSNGKGPLAEELVRTLQDIAVGQPRREAYLALADRTGVQDLRRFIRAVVQADQYGVSIADVLRTQAQEMRLKRRQRAEEKAMQIPVKVIFPLILCILPTLFIVLLGPAVMDIIATFSG
jgi:tight adherence protein C